MGLLRRDDTFIKFFFFRFHDLFSKWNDLVHNAMGCELNGILIQGNYP